MATAKLADWISFLDFSSLPQPVNQAAVRSFQNSLGCIVGGSNHATVRRAIDALKSTFGPRGQCTILGQSHRIFDLSTQKSNPTSEPALQTDPSTAALINGIASHVHDYDDTHLHTVIHPAGAVVVALLAYSQTLSKTSNPISGQAFITALVAGIEVGLRLGNAISPNHYSAGWHITGTVSPIAVATALAHLLHLSPEPAGHAIGIAVTEPVGIRVHFGTDAKALHAGKAAENGILAAQLAQTGFTAAGDALEGRRGWVEVLGHGANLLDEQVEQLLTFSKQASTTGQESELHQWEIEKNTFKPFPCGIVIHPTIDACIQLHDELHLSKHAEVSSVIETVHLRVHPLVLDLTGKKTPRDGLEAKFSVYHGAAIGLVPGSATPAEYADEIVTNAAIIAVRDKVVAEVDNSIRSDEAVVTITLDSTGEGQEEIKKTHIEHAVGSLAHPMTNEQLKEKFMKQVTPILGDQKAKELDETAWSILRCEDVAMIVRAAD